MQHLLYYLGVSKPFKTWVKLYNALLDFCVFLNISLAKFLNFVSIVLFLS
jgi:hypothetical protein